MGEEARGEARERCHFRRGGDGGVGFGEFDHLSRVRRRSGDVEGGFVWGCFMTGCMPMNDEGKER